jgi:hypothetical protein
VVRGLLHPTVALFVVLCFLFLFSHLTFCRWRQLHRVIVLCFNLRYCRWGWTQGLPLKDIDQYLGKVSVFLIASLRIVILLASLCSYCVMLLG